MTKRDYYEVLGLPRQATPEEVKKAYRQAALKFHPDRNPGDKAAEEKFKESAEAYSVLIDQEKRAVYDRFGHDGLRHEGFGGFSGFDPSTFEDFEDILGNFFGFSFGDLFGGRGRSRRGRGQRGRDLALELELSLEEAAAGLEKDIAVSRAETCPDCRGSGLRPAPRKRPAPHAKAGVSSATSRASSRSRGRAPSAGVRAKSSPRRAPPAGGKDGRDGNGRSRSRSPRGWMTVHG
jgi:molecular chaperone DnaJ